MNERVVFTSSGTVQAEGGTYLTRQADKELLELCRRGEYAYVLTARQMGKSSLMVATATRLQEEGIRSAIVDLQPLGAASTTAEQWYRGVLERLARRLRVRLDLVAWWKEHGHLSEVQRFVQFLEDVVLPQSEGRIVVFFDEIDSTISLDFTDDFFIALRYCFTARADNPEFEKLSFVLLGVATPDELIADRNRTPFNIGSLVELADFTEEEAAPFAAGLGVPQAEARQVLRWILGWTGGHPYLTQRVCQDVVHADRPHQSEEAIALPDRSRWTKAGIAATVAQLFFGEKREQDKGVAEFRYELR